MPEVYYEVNRPDLNALYVNQLIQRDFSRQGSTDTWVRYLTKGTQRNGGKGLGGPGGGGGGLYAPSMFHCLE